MEELFEAIAIIPDAAVVGSLVGHICPMIASSIASPVTEGTMHVPSEAIQLANSLLRGRGGPIEEQLVSSVTAAVMVCLEKTEDLEIVQVDFCLST